MGDAASAGRELARARREAEELQPVAPAPEPEPAESDPLDALETDARRRVEQAEAAEARLSLHALSDPAAASELRDVQSERAAAESVLRHARPESERKAVAEAEDAERKHVENERGAADALCTEDRSRSSGRR
jgi:hypothetical protein